MIRDRMHSTELNVPRMHVCVQDRLLIFVFARRTVEQKLFLYESDISKTNNV